MLSYLTLYIVIAVAFLVVLPLILISFLFKPLPKKELFIPVTIVVIVFLIICLIASLIANGNDNISIRSFFVFQTVFFLIGIAIVYFFEKFISKKLTHILMGEIIILIAFIGTGYFVFYFIGNEIYNIIKLNRLIDGSHFALGLTVVPLWYFFRRTYQALLLIPLPEYKLWKFPESDIYQEFFKYDRDSLLLIDFELKDHPKDTNFKKYTVKAPPSFTLGTFFHLFLSEQNKKREREGRELIQLKGEDDNGYKWLFYLKPVFIFNKKILDPDISIEKLKIKDKAVIVGIRIIRDDF